MKITVMFLGVFVFSLFSTVALADDSKLITVDSPRGVKQSFLFASPAAPKAGAILFVGGNGDLDEGEDSYMFLVRGHEDFVRNGLMVAIIATPSDKNDGIYAPFRVSRKHAKDIGAVIKYMKNKADVPLWIIGHSAGGFSAASVAIKKKNLISGLVLASTLTRADKEKKFLDNYPKGVATLNLHKFNKPALIIIHKDDTCDLTLPANAHELKDKLKRSPRVELIIMDGGSTPADEPCESRSQHGFYGKEEATVDRIAAFILQ